MAEAGKLQRCRKMYSLTTGEMTFGSGSYCFLERDAVSACGGS